MTALVKISPASNGFRSPLKKGRERTALAVLVASLALTAHTNAQPRPIDVQKSVLTVRVYKAGLLSAAGHNHEIAARLSGGSVDASAHRVEVRASAAALQVRDPEASEKDRAEIQSTMLGPKVLEAERYPEITFQSTSAEPAGGGSWKVEGNLTLHGQTRPVSVEVKETGGHYVGASRFKQTEFGIKPIKIGGGTIRVKDEIRIEFDIHLASKDGQVTGGRL